MNFEIIRDNLTTIFGNAEAGRYKTVDYQVQGSDAAEFIGNDRRIQVFYDSGDFSKGNASLQGPTQHEATYNVWLTVTAESKADLSVLNDPQSTPVEKAAALSLLDNNAAARVNNSIDELFGIAYQILMDGTNLDVGTSGPPYIISSRWVSGMQKNGPQGFGSLVTLTGSIAFTCQIVETVTGDTGTASVEPVFDIVNEIEGETDNQKTGAKL